MGVTFLGRVLADVLGSPNEIIVDSEWAGPGVLSGERVGAETQGPTGEGQEKTEAETKWGQRCARDATRCQSLPEKGETDSQSFQRNPLC